MDADSVSMEAQTEIEKLRMDSIADPVIQSDNGSSFIAMEFRTVLRENHLAQKLIRPHTPEQNGIVERANKTVRESLVPVILTDYEQAKYEMSRIIEHYNKRRRHSSLNYLTPIQYYRGNPEELLRIRESKIERARVLRNEREVKRQEVYHNSFRKLSRIERNSTSLRWEIERTFSILEEIMKSEDICYVKKRNYDTATCLKIIAYNLMVISNIDLGEKARAINKIVVC